MFPFLNGKHRSISKIVRHKCPYEKTPDDIENWIAFNILLIMKCIYW